MRWWINKNGVNTGEIFDDEIIENSPGDDLFTQEYINAELMSRNANSSVLYTADYMGPSFKIENKQ